MYDPHGETPAQADRSDGADRVESATDGPAAETTNEETDGAPNGEGRGGTTRRWLLKSAAAAGLAPALAGQASAAGTWTVVSPEGANEATVALSDAGDLTITMVHDGTTAVDSSPLGLSTAAEEFTTGLTFQGRTDATDSGSYTTTSGSRLDHSYDATLTTLSFTNENSAVIELDVRASADGVAFRYRIPGSDTVEVTDEDSSFSIPGDPSAWVMPFSNDFESTNPGDYYEEDWRETTTAETSGEYGWGPLFEVNDAVWLLLAEADVTRQYPTTRIETDAGSTTFTTTLPSSASSDAPLETPWRVAVMGDLERIVETDVMADLSDPAEFDDTSWVQPGRSSWTWWSQWEVTSFQRQKRYVDFAEKHGWEYHLVDAGWTNYDRVPDLIDYAETVDIVLWADSADIESQSVREDLFSTWSDWGAAGVKVDYFDNDDQATMRFYQDILADAAAHDLAVNLHGVTIPKGWRRKWPNLMTLEAVQGAEYYKWTSVPVEHNNIIPFTRGVLGPMDYTPVTFSASGRETTPAHEVALAVVQESGQIHYADSVDVYEDWPAATRFLDTAAAAWETSHFLGGAPGEYSVFARQKPDSSLWHVGAIANGAREIETDLSFLDDGTTYGYELTTDDGSGGLAVETGTVTSGESLSTSVPDNGGFAVLLYPEDDTAPIAPSNLASPSQSGATVELSWDGSVDEETEVDHYAIYVNGEKHAEWASTHARLELESNTTYDVAVSAVDVAGNESETTDTITVTTGIEIGLGTGLYWLENVNSGLALDVFDLSTEEGGNVVQWSYNGGANQHWTIVENDDGTYRLRNRNSGMVLAVENAATSNAASVVQQSWTGADHQRWDVVENDDGSYRLINENSGLVADVNEAGTSNGDNVIQWPYGGGSN